MSGIKQTQKEKCGCEITHQSIQSHLEDHLEWRNGSCQIQLLSAFTCHFILESQLPGSWEENSELYQNEQCQRHGGWWLESKELL